MRLGLAAAVVFAVAIGVGLFRSMQARETFRGVQNGTAHLESADPAALKRQLIAELSVAGVKAAGYERPGHLGIDAGLPPPISAPARQVLERHHIPVPPDGVLRVEIEPPAKP